MISRWKEVYINVTIWYNNATNSVNYSFAHSGQFYMSVLVYNIVMYTIEISVQVSVKQRCVPVCCVCLCIIIKLYVLLIDLYVCETYTNSWCVYVYMWVSKGRSDISQLLDNFIFLVVNRSMKYIIYALMLSFWNKINIIAMEFNIGILNALWWLAYKDSKTRNKVLMAVFIQMSTSVMARPIN